MPHGGHHGGGHHGGGGFHHGGGFHGGGSHHGGGFHHHGGSGHRSSHHGGGSINVVVTPGHHHRHRHGWGFGYRPWWYFYPAPIYTSPGRRRRRRVNPCLLLCIFVVLVIVVLSVLYGIAAATHHSVDLIPGEHLLVQPKTSLYGAVDVDELQYNGRVYQFEDEPKLRPGRSVFSERYSFVVDRDGYYYWEWNANHGSSISVTFDLDYTVSFIVLHGKDRFSKWTGILCIRALSAGFVTPTVLLLHRQTHGFGDELDGRWVTKDHYSTGDKGSFTFTANSDVIVYFIFDNVDAGNPIVNGKANFSCSLTTYDTSVATDLCMDAKKCKVSIDSDHSYVFIWNPSDGAGTSRYFYNDGLTYSYSILTLWKVLFALSIAFSVLGLVALYFGSIGLAAYVTRRTRSQHLASEPAVSSAPGLATAPEALQPAPEERQPLTGDLPDEEALAYGHEVEPARQPAYAPGYGEFSQPATAPPQPGFDMPPEAMHPALYGQS